MSTVPCACRLRGSKGKGHRLPWKKLYRSTRCVVDDPEICAQPARVMHS